MDRLQVKILKSMFDNLKLSSVTFEEFLRLKGVINVEQILKEETNTAIIKRVP
jgi:hypothetical protein